MTASALKPVTRTYTFTSGVTVTLATILGMEEVTWMGTLALRAGRDNAGDIYWQDENGQSGGYIGGGEAVTMDFGAGMALLQNISLMGTTGDTVFVTAGISRYYFEKSE